MTSEPMTAEPSTPEPIPASVLRRLLLNVAVAVPFGLLFAYDVWQAIGNIVGIVTWANYLQVPVVGWGWVVLIGSAVLPALIWVLAVVLGWKRPLLPKLAIQFLGLCVAAATYLSIITMFNSTNLLVLNS